MTILTTILKEENRKDKKKKISIFSIELYNSDCPYWLYTPLS